MRRAVTLDVRAAAFHPPVSAIRAASIFGRGTPLNDEVVELALLLPRRQAAALEAAAHGRGLTAGQMLRKLIGASLREFGQPAG